MRSSDFEYVEGTLDYCNNTLAEYQNDYIVEVINVSKLETGKYQVVVRKYKKRD